MAKQVFDTLKIIEREVTDKKGHRFYLRILPYRTEGDLIKGLIITFIDIEVLIKTRDRMFSLANRFKAIFNNSSATIIITTKSGDV